MCHFRARTSQQGRAIRSTQETSARPPSCLRAVAGRGGDNLIRMRSMVQSPPRLTSPNDSGRILEEAAETRADRTLALAHRQLTAVMSYRTCTAQDPCHPGCSGMKPGKITDVSDNGPGPNAVNCRAQEPRWDGRTLIFTADLVAASASRWSLALYSSGDQGCAGARYPSPHLCASIWLAWW
jgi:hypothetical protein